MWEELPGGGFYSRSIGKPILRKARPGPKRKFDALVLSAQSSIAATGRYSGVVEEWNDAAASYRAIVGVFGGMENSTPVSIWAEIFHSRGWTFRVVEEALEVELPGWSPPPPPPDHGFQPPLFDP